jgi:hypothetical protein
LSIYAQLASTATPSELRGWFGTVRCGAAVLACCGRLKWTLNQMVRMVRFQQSCSSSQLRIDHCWVRSPSQACPPAAVWLWPRSHSPLSRCFRATHTVSLHRHRWWNRELHHHHKHNFVYAIFGTRTLHDGTACMRHVVWPCAPRSPHFSLHHPRQRSDIFRVVHPPRSIDCTRGLHSSGVPYT